jgi:hypothetical protein
MSKFTFTQPITKTGVADYVHYMRNTMKTSISHKWAKNRGVYMSYQALREAGLLEYKNSEYILTHKGNLYLSCIDSSNIVPKSVIKSILNCN